MDGKPSHYQRLQQDICRAAFRAASALREVAMTDTIDLPGELSVNVIDCRSELGITVGLVDALISICRVLAKRDLSPRDVQEALRDMATDDDLKYILGEVGGTGCFGSE